MKKTGKVKGICSHCGEFGKLLIYHNIEELPNPACTECIKKYKSNLLDTIS